MGEMMRNTDWSATPLGPREQWSSALLTAVEICLGSRLCSCIYWGPEFRIVYNDAYSDILGTKHPWALGRPACEVWSEMFRIIGPLLEETFRTGRTTGSDDAPIFLNRFGYLEEFYCSFSYAPLINEKGEIEAVYAILPETSKRVIGERRLQTLQQLGTVGEAVNGLSWTLQTAAAAISQNPYDIPFAAFYLWDESGLGARLSGTAGIETGTSLTPATAFLEDPTLMGLAGRWNGKQIDTLRLPPDLHDVPSGPWEVPPNSIVLVPFAASVAQGPRGFLLAGVNPLKRLDKDYLLFFKMIGNHIEKLVTAAFIYEQESARARALADLDRAKTAFFNDISHELRTPLMLMLGPLNDVISDHTGLTQEQLGSLSVSQRNGNRLLKLVNDILDFARDTTDHGQPRFEPIDLAAETTSLAETFEWVARQTGISLKIDCSPLREPVYLDREMWEKILVNLLANAFNYTREGEIAISLRQVKNAARLVVRDTGVGIQRDKLGRIFERFYRIEGVHGRSGEGTGIGLALVKALTERQAGRVWAESIPGKGSAFSVEFPLGSGHLPRDHILPDPARESGMAKLRSYGNELLAWMRLETGDPAAEATGKDSDLPTDRKSILLVDDNADLRRYVGKALTERFDVQTASTGAEALKLIARRQPSLVISDVRMPDTDGLSLLRTLRANHATATMPVILLTAYAGEESKLKGLAQGADDYLVKPFGMRELVARAEAAIDRAQLRYEVAQREERLRLARDLHDYLLQSVQGAGLMLEAGLELGSANRKHGWQFFEQARQALQQAVREGRDVLSTLRSTTEATEDLRQALQRLGGEFVQNPAVAFEVREIGTCRDISPSAWPEVYGMCREAVANAARHADATRIVVEVRHGRSLQLSIRDNGRGIADEFILGTRQAHFGLTGMRERAAKLKGRLNIDAKPQGGTSVMISLPGRMVYAGRSGARS